MSEPDEKSIGVRIQKQRLLLGITQRELAEKAGLEALYVSQLETGRRIPSVNALYRIADALAVRAGFILDGENAEDETPLAEEVKKLLDGWNEDQQKALIKALRALKEI